MPALLFKAALLAAIWYVLLPSPALAYFDLGTGTYLVQMVLAFLAAFWLSFRQSWLARLPFGKRKEVTKQPPPEDAPDTSAT